MWSILKVLFKSLYSLLVLKGLIPILTMEILVRFLKRLIIVLPEWIGSLVEWIVSLVEGIDNLTGLTGLIIIDRSFLNVLKEWFFHHWTNYFFHLFLFLGLADFLIMIFQLFLKPVIGLSLDHMLDSHWSVRIGVHWVIRRLWGGFVLLFLILANGEFVWLIVRDVFLIGWLGL